jgi:predicted enzyme related to lactoylglutathione lyase
MSAKNPIGWFEITVNDFDKAKNFYTQLFGWEFRLSQASKTLYWNIYTGKETIGGGLLKKSKPEHNGQAIMLYVEVEDIEAILNKAVSLGGSIEKPKTLISETAGYFGLLLDLDKNTIGLWSRS